MAAIATTTITADSSSSSSSVPAKQTAMKIPCCICGSMILPNAANQCGSCLARDMDLSAQLQKGPGSAEYSTIHQCRQCRRYQQSPKNYIHAEPESPELLALCLKHIPALQEGAIRIRDAVWVWTEPHSMRFQIRITAQTEVQNVTIQQRVLTELRCTFQMCPDCNREYTNRTWHAVLQVRQRHTTKGLRALEMAIAKADSKIRKHVIRLDSTNAGLDFYFLELRQAQQLCQFIATLYPSRTKVTQKLVSEDVKNSSANMKYTVSCELAPLAKNDLIILEAKQIPHTLSGRLALVTHVTAGLFQCVDALTMERMDISAELYYKYEKYIHSIPCSTVRAIVLDVESTTGTGGLLLPQLPPQRSQRQQPSSSSSSSSMTKEVLRHEVQLLLGTNNDEVVPVTTHIGNYLTAGDTVLVYDLRNSTVSIEDDWLQHSYLLPDVVVIQKTSPLVEDNDHSLVEPSAAADHHHHHHSKTNLGKKLSKRKERRQRKENQRMKDLEDRAARMGFVQNDTNDDYSDVDHGSLSSDMVNDVAQLEKELD